MHYHPMDKRPIILVRDDATHHTKRIRSPLPQHDTVSEPLLGNLAVNARPFSTKRSELEMQVIGAGPAGVV